MKDRIAHIMRAQNLKASDFAELLGIQPSGISHILSGRNQPSLDFVKKIKETFPEYNLDWIIFGKGPMTTSDPFSLNSSPISASSSPIEFVAPSNEEVIPSTETSSSSSSLFSSASVPPTNAAPVTHQTGSAQSGIQSLFVVYDDGTFVKYSPR